MASAERGKTVSMIAAGNAGEGFIPPMLIFTRDNFKDFMIHKVPEVVPVYRNGLTRPPMWCLWISL